MRTFLKGLRDFVFPNTSELYPKQAISEIRPVQEALWVAYVIEQGDHIILPTGQTVMVDHFGVKYISRYNRSPSTPPYGVYEDRTEIWVNDNGEIYQLPGDISFQMVDEAKYLRRMSLYEERRSSLLIGNRTGDLPETAFWETDIVGFKGDQYVVHRINYYPISRRNQATYELEMQDGGIRMHIPETEMTLIQRGNLWNYYSGRETEFKDLEAMANFYLNLGDYTEVKANSSYLPTVLHMLENGTVDLVVGSGITYLGNSVVKLNNLELGDRIRPFMIERVKEAIETQQKVE